MQSLTYIFSYCLFAAVSAFDKDLTFTVQAGRTECFYQNVMANETIEIDYQVIDATHGELDISFQLSDPVGRIIVADYKKDENSHAHSAEIAGDYRFCFDNTFSTFSEKTVFFDLWTYMQNGNEEVDRDEREISLGGKIENYTMKIDDISQSVNKIQSDISMARRLQEQHSAHEARDRNLAEDMCDRVMSWSMLQIVLMLIVGITQVIFVKSLFEDPNSGTGIRKVLKNLSR